jgi:uncharacterized membrane protein YbhN (UPF0104 family)
VNKRALKIVAVTIFVATTLAFFVYAVIKAWNDTNGDIPSIPRLVAAITLWAGGLIVSAWAWAAMLGGPRRLHHGAGFVVSQLAKYVPGGIWQATGQVGLAKSAGVAVSQGATAFSALAVCQMIAGCSFGIVLAVTWTDASWLVRGLCAAGGVAALGLLDRRWMVWALRRIPRTREASSELVPPQRIILFAWAMGVITLVASGTAYVIVLGSFGSVSNPLFVLSAYSAAWTVGFVAVPIPSGVGVREAVLVFILHGTFPSSVLVAASVYHRLAAIAAEGLMAAIAAHRVRPRHSVAPPAAGSGPGP